MADVIAADVISLAGAQRVLAAALAAAEAAGHSMCIVVADISGEPVVSARMDGAPRLSARIAADKAYTVAGFNGMPTAAWWGAIKDSPELVHGITHTPRLTIFGGGVPLMSGGRLVGAIGVSGGSADDDATVAAAGASVVE
jgi:glc operon protein GlcG